VRKKETAQISRIWISHFKSQYCKTAATFRYVRSDDFSVFSGVFMC
jgi:hypothetical protein